jgi:hypothetical protein
VNINQFVVTLSNGEQMKMACPEPVTSTGNQAAQCVDGIVQENDDFWRDASLGSVTADTVYYDCPHKKACFNGTQCAPGHGGPLCAVCKRGFAMAFGECAKCPGPEEAAGAIGVILGVFVAVVAAWMLVSKKQNARLKKALVSDKSKSLQQSLLKIAIGFYTLVGCMEFTFGVPWPTEFQSFLRAMQMLTLDLSSLSGFFCSLNGFNYYDMLLGATVATLAVVAVICARLLMLERKRGHALDARDLGKPKELEKLDKKTRGLKRALFYIGIFLYPILNLRVFQVFVVSACVCRLALLDCH